MNVGNEALVCLQLSALLVCLELELLPELASRQNVQMEFSGTGQNRRTEQVDTKGCAALLRAARYDTPFNVSLAEAKDLI